MLKRFLSTVVIDTPTNDYSGNTANIELTNYNPLLKGIIIGAVITLCIIGLVKYLKWILKDNQKMQEKVNSQKSDE